jgi:2',3'-cyclic-nucleotide 2'-phosphodiesterase (5'-nucleotidase family)
LFPIRTNEIEPDAEIEKIITRLREPYKAELERVIGETSTLLYRQGTWQSTADNLVTDALRERTKQNVVMKQPGRYGATILPGPITVEDIFNIIPVESTIYYMKFSGNQLRMILEGSLDNVISRDAFQQIGANMIRFSGIELNVDLSKPYLNRIQKITINDKTVRDKTLYSLAEFDLFLRNSPEAIEVTKTDKIGPHEVIAYIEAQGNVVGKLDRRITDHHGKIMADSSDLNEIWEITGQNKVNLDTDKVFKYQGRLDKWANLKSKN